MIASAETALRRTAWLQRIAAGAVNRVAPVQADRDDARGGMVAKIIHRLGWPTIAFGLVDDALPLDERTLDDEGVPHHFVHVGNRARTGTGVRLRALADRVSMLEDVVRFWLQPGLERPDLVRVDLSGIERLAGHCLVDEHAVVHAAREIVEDGPRIVVVSLSDRGAVCVDRGTSSSFGDPRSPTATHRGARTRCSLASRSRSLKGRCSST